MQMNTMTKRKDFLASLGIVLAIAGVSSMGIVKGVIGSNMTILSTLIVIVSVVLLAKGSRIGYITVPTEEIGLIFLYSLVSLVLAVFSGIPLMKNGYGFIYQAAGFLQILLIWNFDFDNDMDFFVEIGFWFCGVFCFIALILLLKKTGGTLFVNSFESEDGEYLFSRSTIGSIGFKSFVMALAKNPQSRRQRMVRSAILIIAATVIIASTRRGAYVATIVCCILHYRHCGAHKGYVDVDSMIKKVILVVCCILIFLVAYNKFSFIQDTLGHAVEMLVNGIKTFLGLDNSDMAASMRTSSASRVINQYLYNSTPKQVLLGRGYMTTWVDVPIIQAFWDLGLVGGFTFGVIHFVIPIRYIAKEADTQGLRAAQYLTVMSVLEGVMSGYPYGRFFDSTLLIMLYTARELDKKAERNERRRL